MLVSIKECFFSENNCFIYNINCIFEGDNKIDC